MLPLNVMINGIDVFILVFVRMTGLFVIAPIFGRRNLPVIYKIAFSFLLAIILTNTISKPNIGGYDNIWAYGALVIKEFLAGIAIGYVSFLIFTAIYLAGELIDMQIGFGMVNVMDPMSNIQIPVTANYYYILSMIAFFTINGHHALIRCLFDSYSSIPLGGTVFNNALMNDIIRVFGDMFALGFKIAAPITAAMIISDIALGVISKTIPQMNVFAVGMPMKILIGIIVMIVTIPLFIMLLGDLRDSMNLETVKFIKDLGSG